MSDTTQAIARAWADAGIISHADYLRLCREHGWTASA